MNLPLAFLERTRLLLGDEAEALFTALDEAPPVSIRLNPSKMDLSSGTIPVLSKGEDLLSGTIPVPWSSFGQYLDERPAFTFDPMLHAGCYYVQEASSMFVEQAFRRALSELDTGGLKVLDLCAAPGGKSTLLASCLPADGLLVANELIRTRANILAENLIKWGLPNVVTTQSDPSAFSGLMHFFDVILTDVPCSGEGMFRKDPASVEEWSPENVELCAHRQRDIVRSVWPSLKPGGFLIYSTCTYNLSEDEQNVQWICEDLGGNPVRIPVDASWGISGAQGAFKERDDFPVYRFFPHYTRGEGFFLALIQKGEEESASVYVHTSAVKKADAKKKSAVLPNEIQNLLKKPTDFEFYTDRQGRIAAFPSSQYDTLKTLEKSLRIVHAGIVTGEIKGKDLVPDISLALSTSLEPSAVKSYALNLKQTIDFLRKEAFQLPEDCPLGWVLIGYESHPLGWMKNIGNRANNPYPNEWRIRSENPY
jgi:16S rRNA (cytosine1407-C5)-methyltransferase